MAKNEAKIRFTAETGEFNAAIKKSNDEMSELRAEMKLNEAQMKTTGATVEGLENKHKILSAQLAASEDKTEALSQKVNKAAEIFGENSAEVTKLRTQLLNAQTAEEKIRQAISACNDELEAQKSAAKQAESATERLANTIEDQQSELNKLKSAYTDAVLEHGKYSKEAKTLAKQIDSLSDELSDNRKRMNEVESAADKLDNSLDNIDETAEEVSEGFTVLKGAMADLLADGIEGVVDGLADIGTEAFTMANDIDKASNTFVAKTGESVESAEQFEDVMTDIYNNNFGDSFEDIADAMATVRNNLGDMDDGKLQKMTEGAILLRDTFDYDVNETTRTASMLMKQFGIDGETAYSMIATGAQNGLDKNGDLLDTLNEYAVHYKNLGYDVDDMLNMLVNGTESGTFSVDKLGDAVKEFGIRTKDTSKTTTEGFEMIGLNADKMRDAFAKGGDSAQKATQQTLEALFGMDDQVKQNQAGVALFGTMWEDLGVDGVKALMDINGEVGVSTDALNTLNEVKYNDLGSALEGVKRNLQTSVTEPIQNDVMPAVNEFIQNVDWGSVGETIGEVMGVAVDGMLALAEGAMQAVQWMSEHKAVMAGVAAAVGIVTTAITAYNVVQGVKTAMDAANVTTVWALVSAHWAQATAAMAAIAPYVAVVAAIAAVIAIIVLCIKHWDDIVAAVKNAWEKIKETLAKWGEWIDSNVIQPIANFFKNLWSGITETFSNVGGWFKDKFNSAKEAVVSKATEMKEKATQKWNEMKSAASEKFQAIKDKIGTTMQAAKETVSEKLSNMKQAYQEHGGGIKGIAAAAIEGVKGYYTAGYSFIDKLTGGKLSDIVGKFKSGMSNVKNAVSTAFTNVKNSIANGLSNALSTVTSKLTSIKNKFSSIMDSAKNIVSTAISKIKNLFNFKWSLPKIKLPHFTVSPSGWKFGDLLKGSIPKLSISWYKDGAIFEKPTIFGTEYGLKGVGEAGAEAVLPIEKLEGYIANAVEKHMNVINMQSLADAIEDLANRPNVLTINGRQFALATASDGDSVNGVRTSFINRGLAVE